MIPLISIIIPYYNSSKTIEKAIRSVLSSNNSLIEIIIIDDCSVGDEYVALINIVSQIKKELEIDNITVIKNNINKGAGETRNVGIEIAKGSYLLFLDSDDFFLDGSLNYLLMFAEKEYDILFFDAIINNSKRKKFKMFFSPSIKEGKLEKETSLVFARGCTCGKMYKTSLIKQNGIRFSHLIINEDLVFTKTAIAHTQNNLYYINKPFYNYNVNNNTSLMHINKAKPDNYELIAYDEIKNKLSRDTYSCELYSIFFLEVVYAYSKKMFLYNGFNKAKNAYSNLFRMYDPSKDIYYKNYNLKFRIVYRFLKALNG